MTFRPNRHLRRQLEADLRDDSNFPVAPPPADLLAKIRAEIPADLRAANSEEPVPATRRRFTSSPGFRLAASIAVAVVGVALGYRVIERGKEPAREPARTATAPQPVAKGALLETAPNSEFEAKAEDKGERLPLKGKTKDVGSDAGEWNGSGRYLDESRAASADSAPPASALRKAEVEHPAKVPPPPSPSLPPASVGGATAESSTLQALGYMGGATTEAAPVRPRRRDSNDRQADSPAEPDASAPEQITITAPTPLLDSRKMETRATADKSEAERVPTARDPWVILQTTPGVLVDRLNVDSNEAGGGAGSPSTGGSNEPNEQAAGDMFFRPVDTNPFVDTAEDRLSTFALDVDTGSWTLARSYLERGTLPPPEAIRIEEFVNAQSYDDPAPRRGDFTLVAEGAPSPFAPGASYRLVRFAVKAHEIDARDRKPAVLTFVVDVSGSMDRENRLGLVKRALGLLLDELRADDRVALVVYGTRGRVLLRHTRDHEAIREAIAALRPEGSTNAEEGLRFGYDLADEAWQRESINRIVLCSDGVANVGATGPESILARIGSEARRGIELTTVGFGMGNYNDALMEQLADQGDGSYHYVDSLDEARRIFVENLTGTLQTVARDAKAQVEFDPRVVERWRLVGYENRDVADRDFRDDAVDAGEIGAGHSAVALYEVRLREGARSGDPVGTLHLRWKSRATHRVEESALTLEVGDLDGSFRSASANLRTAAVAAELGEMLKGGFYARAASWEALAAEAHRLEHGLRGDARRDLSTLVDRAAGLAAQRAPADDGRGPRDDRRPRDDD